jgi:hypothetical protein
MRRVEPLATNFLTRLVNVWSILTALAGESKMIPTDSKKSVAHLFDWATRFLDAQGRAEYKRAIEAAEAEYWRATAPAQAEYNRATAPARDEYYRAAAAALAKLNRALVD